jgi:hypothetical protein
MFVSISWRTLVTVESSDVLGAHEHKHFNKNEMNSLE